MFYVLGILLVGYFSIKYVKEKKSNDISEEYIPQEEISDEQYRETIVSLYFPDKENKSLKPEARMVNVKELIQSPYSVLMQLLIKDLKRKVGRSFSWKCKIIKCINESRVFSIRFFKWVFKLQ